VEFEFDEDQRLLQESVRETLGKVKDQPEDRLWTTYLELGWMEAPPVELAIVLEELGYIADPTPFLASATWFAPLAGRLPRGSGTGVFAGTGQFILDIDRADEVALLTPDGVKIVPGAELAAERVSTFDHRLHIGHLTGDAGDLTGGVPDLALMGLAITTVGACRKILDLVVAHVRQRHQFGVPIGSFQAVKHKAADMYVAIERARVLAYYSALTIAEDAADKTRAAHMAKAAAGECQQLVFANGFQLFGAMGFTWENELHLYLKRALAGDLLLGGTSEHRRAIVEVAALCAWVTTPRSRSSARSSRSSSTSTRPRRKKRLIPRRPAPTCPPGPGAGSDGYSTMAGSCPCSRRGSAAGTPPCRNCWLTRRNYPGGGSITTGTPRAWG